MTDGTAKGYLSSADGHSWVQKRTGGSSISSDERDERDASFETNRTLDGQRISGKAPGFRGQKWLKT